jgi:hypothetical protein
MPTCTATLSYADGIALQTSATHRREPLRAEKVCAPYLRPVIPILREVRQEQGENPAFFGYKLIVHPAQLVFSGKQELQGIHSVILTGL